jgi:hypothetical protein
MARAGETFFLVFVLLFRAASAQPADRAPSANLDRPPIPREEQERFLSTASIIKRVRIAEGTTHPTRLTLADGVTTHDAQFQAIDVHKPVMKLADGRIVKDFADSYKYNIAAYRVDKMLDLNMSPTCVYREIDAKPGSVCWWLDDIQFDELGRRRKKAEPPDAERWVRELNNVRVFDQLIDNEDRNQGNLLYDRNWNLWMIDHTRAFSAAEQLRHPESLRRVSLKMLNAMRAITYEQCRRELQPFLTDQQIRAMLARRNLLLDFFNKEVSEKGVDAVYTDLPRSTPHVTIP